MARKTFSPYDKGIPERKAFPSRYESIRDTTVSGGPNPAGAKPTGSGTPPAHGAAHRPDAPRAFADNVSGNVTRPVQGTAPHASTRVPGAGKREGGPPVDRDLLDGLEGNHRRQRGWAEDDNPDELVDGIAITPISRDELKKKLAAQKSGGFLGGKNL